MIEKILIIKFLVIVTILALAFIFVINLIVTMNNENILIEKASHEKICENLGLELLSVSKELFTQDYIICYNKLNKKTERILI